MKRILTAMCALALMAAGTLPALAAESSAPKTEPEQSCYYPIKVEEYTSGPLDELRIDKVYQLSLSDDPSGIPTEDFVRNGGCTICWTWCARTRSVWTLRPTPRR